MPSPFPAMYPYDAPPPLPDFSAEERVWMNALLEV